MVTTQQDAVVQKDAQQGSVYCLFYLDRSKIDTLKLSKQQVKETIPNHVMDMVEKDNLRLKRKQQDYGKRMQSFLSEFKKTKNEQLDRANNPFGHGSHDAMLNDHRLRHESIFLYNIDQKSLADSILFKQVYKQFIQSELDANVSDGNYHALREYLQDKPDDLELLQNAINVNQIDLDQSSIHFDNFRLAAQASLLALKEMNRRNYIPAIHCWGACLRVQNLLKDRKLRVPQYQEYFDFATCNQIHNIVLMCKNHVSDECRVQLTHCVAALITYGGPKSISSLYSEFNGNLYSYNHQLRDILRPLCNYLSAKDKNPTRVIHLKWEIDDSKVPLVPSSQMDFGKFITERYNEVKKMKENYSSEINALRGFY
ncbi:hypothetical protein AKO1_007404 [Acrasis kona]|uniref:Uncharacterized protein n=1 Tax=Acrasis kona TaxID=1008807 RepID=A0AAW2YUD7_9EUKA